MGGVVRCPFRCSGSAWVAHAPLRSAFLLLGHVFLVVVDLCAGPFLCYSMWRLLTPAAHCLRLRSDRLQCISWLRAVNSATCILRKGCDKFAVHLLFTLGLLLPSLLPLSYPAPRLADVLVN